MIGSNWPVNDEPWVADAVCAQTDPELFFPEKGYTPHAAKKICMGCVARLDCLDYALRTYQRYGVWGGTTERERRKLWAQQGHPDGTLDAEPDHDAA